MERKWLALTPGDTLPLRLGAKVVTAKPKARKVVDSRAGPVKWVTSEHDSAVRLTDLAHEAAPRPIGTAVYVAPKLAHSRKMRCSEPGCAVCAEPLWEGKAITIGEAERAMTAFINLPPREQDTLLGARVLHREPGERFAFRSKCGCDDCRVIRVMVQRERSGPTQPKRGIKPLLDLKAQVQKQLLRAAMDQNQMGVRPSLLDEVNAWD